MILGLFWYYKLSVQWFLKFYFNYCIFWKNDFLTLWVVSQELVDLQKCNLAHIKLQNLSFPMMYDTLSSQIIVYARLFFSRDFSSLHALIRSYTFIYFSQKMKIANWHTYKNSKLGFLYKTIRNILKNLALCVTYYFKEFPPYTII